VQVTLILVASALIGVHLRFLQLLKSLDIDIVPPEPKDTRI